MPSGSACTRYGPAGQVDRGLDQRLVQRHQRVAEPADAGLVAERLAQRLAERERGVLDGVVRVDLEVALGLHGQVEAAVLAELGQHVVEERHAGVDVGDRRCRPGRARPGPWSPWWPARPARSGSRRSFQLACGPASTALSAARNAAISAGVPTLTRSQPRRARPRGSARRGRAAPARPRAGRRTGRTARSWRRSRPRPGPCSRSQATTASRSARIAATVASSSPGVRAARPSATAWVSADRW